LDITAAEGYGINLFCRKSNKILVIIRIFLLFFAPKSISFQSFLYLCKQAVENNQIREDIKKPKIINKT